MAEHAATLVDDLLPQVPVRQWVLTLPYRLRYRLAWDHALCRAVLGVFARTLLAFYARTAQARGIPAGQTDKWRQAGISLGAMAHTRGETWPSAIPCRWPGNGRDALRA